MYTGKAAYSVLIFLAYKNAPGGWKEFEAGLAVLFFCREIFYIFSVKWHCSAYWQKYLENMNGTVCENGFSLCFCSFYKEKSHMENAWYENGGKKNGKCKKISEAVSYAA